MEKAFQDGIVGIVAGLITTWLIILGRYLWVTKATPYFRAVRYQGVDIGGPWVSHGTNNDVTVEHRLFLRQSAHDLAGSFLFSFASNEKSFKIDFDVKGYMWEGYVTLNFIPRDKKVTSYATTLLKLHGGGVELRGQMCFRNVESETVDAITLSFFRGTLPT